MHHTHGDVQISQRCAQLHKDLRVWTEFTVPTGKMQWTPGAVSLVTRHTTLQAMLANQSTADHELCHHTDDVTQHCRTCLLTNLLRMAELQAEQRRKTQWHPRV
jgi:hypothetical protein